MGEPVAKIRLDKWLWYARFFKTRSLAARQVSDGQVRVNGERTTKPAFSVGAGDVLTFVQAREIRVVQVLQPGTRRGPAPEAQDLYEDLTPEAEPKRPSGGARPTKRDRRAIDHLRNE